MVEGFDSLASYLAGAVLALHLPVAFFDLVVRDPRYIAAFSLALATVWVYPASDLDSPVWFLFLLGTVLVWLALVSALHSIALVSVAVVSGLPSLLSFSLPLG